jgi:hypothetical protein
MSRQGQSMAQNTYNTSKGLESGAESNATNLYNQLMPEFSQEATNPQGFGAADLAAMNTASQQSTGGAVASAKGEGALEAARTRNSAGIAPSIEESARDAMRTNSENALNIQGANAKLKQQQQQEGLSGLSNLYGTNTNEVLSSLGLQNAATNDYVNAGNSGWFQNMTGLMNAGANVAKGVASLETACYVAAELYGGWFKPETVAIRAWLGRLRNPIGVAFAKLYARHGRAWAAMAKNSIVARFGFKLLFDGFLILANRG